ncbi:MAG: two-component system response regulator [Nitrospinae bacterium CG11_big_fil_rev_8_21_14_0_20_45_15]|nr:MAG: two-component system response regulator [Nitrospinae bacterium CG11_big_fil_rev_8_21_14_0_20_45_15]
MELRGMGILLVDDNPENLSVLSETLKPDGYKLGFAPNGEKALDVAAHMMPDLILLDVMMPGIDGFETCRRLKANPETQNIPVIFITAKKEEDIMEGFDVGGVDYISKPFRHKEVCARVRSHLELHLLKNKLEQKVKERTHELNVTRLEVIDRLGRAAEYRDNETGLHVKRMSHFSALLARAVGMSDEECDLLLYASPMHDIGKIGIPDHILLKAGKLDAEEWETMKTHTKIGSEILQGSSYQLMQWAQIIALTHQERWDGSGYPKGLKGDEIPLISRIVAISDVFDALTSDRPYKTAWTVEDAMTEIENKSGVDFDPSLVIKFREILPEILDVKQRFMEEQTDSSGR